MVDSSVSTEMQHLCAQTLRVEVSALAEVTTLFVDPTHFGNGVGVQLMHTATEWLRAQHRAPVLEVASCNQAPIGLYRKLGWLEVASFHPTWAHCADTLALFFVKPEDEAVRRVDNPLADVG